VLNSLYITVTYVLLCGEISTTNVNNLWSIMADNYYSRNTWCALTCLCTWLLHNPYEKFEDIKGVIRNRKSKKDRQIQWPKGQTTIYKS